MIYFGGMGSWIGVDARRGSYFGFEMALHEAQGTKGWIFFVSLALGRSGERYRFFGDRMVALGEGRGPIVDIHERINGRWPFIIGRGK